MPNPSTPNPLTIILGSASKLVFLFMALATIGLTAAGMFPADSFEKLALIVFTYYFTRAVPKA